MVNQLIKLIIGFFLIDFILTGTAYAFESTSTSFTIRDASIVIIGGQTTSTSFTNITANGQIVIDESSSTNFQNQNGILYFTLPSASSGGGSTVSGPNSGAGPAPSGSFVTRIIEAVAEVIKKIIPGGSYLAGDLNSDGRVDIYDVGILLHNWHRHINQPFLAAISGLNLSSPDLNNDLFVDIQDLSILLHYWTGLSTRH